MPSSPRERALLAQVILGPQSRDAARDSLAELARLADTAGAAVRGSITQRRERPTAKLFIGEGKIAELQMAARSSGANLVIFDNELTPAQVNNLDLALGLKVIDRTELILQIFARRARSAEAQLQAELAQLQYLVTRVPVSERQHRFTGGIGMRGPGESPFQLRAAPMRRRIADLKRRLRQVQERHRRTRDRRRAWPLAALVGYTNAGKSTLLNALCGARAYVDDRLFATLDTKTRVVRMPGGVDVMLTDTVGFIRNLPHGLIASFRTTLDEVCDADLLLVVADASHPFAEEQIHVVFDTLREIGAESVPRLLVFNKCDVPGAREAAERLLRSRFPGGLAVSAAARDGLDALREAVADGVLRSRAAHPPPPQERSPA